MLRLLRIFGVHPLVGTFQFAGGFSVALEDGPICVHFHRLDDLGENVPMNGSTCIVVVSHQGIRTFSAPVCDNHSPGPHSSDSQHWLAVQLLE